MKWLGLTGLAAAAAASLLFGAWRERDKSAQLVDAVQRRTTTAVPSTLSLAGLDDVPAPVARYFRRVLREGQPSIAVVRLLQAGRLRTGVRGELWFAFSAEQLRSCLGRPGFVWQARLELPFAAHLSVLDSYVDDTG